MSNSSFPFPAFNSDDGGTTPPIQPLSSTHDDSVDHPCAYGGSDEQRSLNVSVSNKEQEGDHYDNMWIATNSNPQSPVGPRGTLPGKGASSVSLDRYLSRANSFQSLPCHSVMESSCGFSVPGGASPHHDSPISNQDGGGGGEGSTVKIKLMKIKRQATSHPQGGTKGDFRFAPPTSTVPLVRPNKDLIRIGICCMKKKAKSATMQAMLGRFVEMGMFEIVVFAEDMIVNTPTEEWPLVDVMIAFFSGGFPLKKAVEYCKLHPHIYYLTDPSSQQVLLDRRDFYSALSRNNIPVVRHVFCNRDGYKGLPDSTLVEGPDFIEVDGVRIEKPFVEKPADSEDHNVYIYYKGGGVTKLFRKVANKSSSHHPELSDVRRDGSFLYEEYVETSNMMDIKCYTVGPNFVHAEARKAPAQDGVVMRDEAGKEIREEVELSGAEMMVARKVIKVFRQVVCGFDILRASSGSFYVCDVNGWSFVKNHAEYVDRATSIMRDIFMEQVRQRGLHRAIRGKSVQRQLCGVVCVMRHGDRTPKQKVKIRVNVEPILMAIFSGDLKVDKEVVLKSGHPKLKHIQMVVTHLLETAACSSDDDQDGRVQQSEANGAVTFKDDEMEELTSTVPQLQELLTPKSDAAPCSTSPEQSDPLEGSNGGLFPISSSRRGSSGLLETNRPMFNFKIRTADNVGKNVLHSLRLMKDVLARHHEGLKIQIKPQEWSTEGVCTEALLVCKWGGWLTEAGEKQSTAMGANLIDRIYGSEVTRIPRYRLDVETNNERRVIGTAVAVSRKLVNDPTIDETCCTVNEELLGSTQDAKARMEAFAAEVKTVLHSHTPDEIKLCSHLPGIPAIINCPVLPMDRRSPYGALQTMHDMLQELLKFLPTDPTTHLYRDESVELMKRRWDNLATSFFQRKSNTYDTTKIPDVFDYVSYDVCYNQQIFAPYDMYPLFTLAETLSVFTSDGEFGLTTIEKRESASLFATPMLNRIHSDLHEMASSGVIPMKTKSTGSSPTTSTPTTTAEVSKKSAKTSSATVPMRKSMHLYVTSESHLVGLRNLLYYNTVDPVLRLEEPMEMHFLAHIVFKVYRYPPTQPNNQQQQSTPSSTTNTPTGLATEDGASQVAEDEDRFQVEVHFSPGVDKNMFGIVQEQHAEYASVTPMIRIHNNLKLSTLRQIVAEYETLQRESTDDGEDGTRST